MSCQTFFCCCCWTSQQPDPVWVSAPLTGWYTVCIIGLKLLKYRRIGISQKILWMFFWYSSFFGKFIIIFSTCPKTRTTSLTQTLPKWRLWDKTPPNRGPQANLCQSKGARCRKFGNLEQNINGLLHTGCMILRFRPSKLKNFSTMGFPWSRHHV